MSFQKYCSIQVELIKRYCERTGNDESIWVSKYAKRFSTHFRNRINN